MLANAVGQLKMGQLNQRIREQARSHMDFVYLKAINELFQPHSFYCHSRPRSTIVATVPVHF